MEAASWHARIAASLSELLPFSAPDHSLTMRAHLLPIPLLSLCGLVAAAGPHWSLAEDPYAFPKYRVSFLNGLPVLNATAERWLAGGLEGGEREFLERDWHDEDKRHGYRSNSVQSIDSGDGSPEFGSVCAFVPV